MINVLVCPVSDVISCKLTKAGTGRACFFYGFGSPIGERDAGFSSWPAHRTDPQTVPSALAGAKEENMDSIGDDYNCEG